MNNVVLLYLKKVMNKLVSIHSDLTGGYSTYRVLSPILKTRY